MRSALAEFAASVEVRLHAEVSRSQSTQLALIEAVHRLREETASRDVEFAGALTSLGQVVEYIGELIESDRIERRALLEAVGRFNQPTNGTTPTPLARRERVVGGTVFGGQSDIEIVSDDEHDDESRVRSQPKWG